MSYEETNRSEIDEAARQAFLVGTAEYQSATAGEITLGTFLGAVSTVAAGYTLHHYVYAQHRLYDQGRAQLTQEQALITQSQVAVAHDKLQLARDTHDPLALDADKQSLRTDISSVAVTQQRAATITANLPPRYNVATELGIDGASAAATGILVGYLAVRFAKNRRLPRYYEPVQHLATTPNY